MNNCTFNKKDTTDVLVLQLKMEVERLMNETTSRLLIQDGKIAELCNYIKDNLSGTISELMNTMKYNGELTDIITDVVLADVMSSIEKRNVYYNGVTCEKIYDEISSCYYYITKVPKFDENGLPLRLRLGIANDNKDVDTLESTLQFARRKNATVCVNCGVYDVDTHLPVGTLIKNGEILYNNMPEDDKYQFLAIRYDGSVKIYDRGTTADAMLLDGVVDCVCIFASLIENGVTLPQSDIRKEPRQSIGFTEEGTIIFITCDGRTYESTGMSYDDLARVHYNAGSFNAFILDGGGSASTVIRGIKQNENIDYFTVDRAVNNFLYIAKDTDVTSDNNSSNDIGIVKQHILEKLYKKIDFNNGYIRLRGPENYYAPGIEMYVNGETSRRSKLGLTFDPNNIRNSYLFWGLKAGETEKNNLFRIYDTGVWVQTYHGGSGSRPNGVIGLCYFDESIGKPIWYDGSKWVDSTGSAV